MGSSSQRSPSRGPLWQRRLPASLPLRYDRASHLGLQLIGDNALCDLVDLARDEIRELRHTLGELGDSASEVRLALGPRGYGFNTSVSVS